MQVFREAFTQSLDTFGMFRHADFRNIYFPDLVHGGLPGTMEANTNRGAFFV